QLEGRRIEEQAIEVISRYVAVVEPRPLEVDHALRGIEALVERGLLCLEVNDASHGAPRLRRLLAEHRQVSLAGCLVPQASRLDARPPLSDLDELRDADSVDGSVVEAEPPRVRPPEGDVAEAQVEDGIREETARSQLGAALIGAGLGRCHLTVSLLDP